ncbi:MAG: cytochrome c3 family protein [Woeseiaceae bacterium]
MEKRDGRTHCLPIAFVVTFVTLFQVPSTSASSLEKWLIMPGPVVSSHADIEDECDACHDPLSDQPQFEFCIVCHEDEGRDIAADTGFHGRLPRAEVLQCAECHTDHEGRDIDIVALDEASFDHALTDFELQGAHDDVACGECHAEGKPHRQAPSTCVGCHQEDDPHVGQLGNDCVACHSTRDWTETFFDHSRTSFPLTGAHPDVACGGCHQSATFSDISSTCVACHQQDDVHKGRNGTECVDCHSTAAWKTVTFNHLAQTGFPLTGGHDGLTCQDCHRADDFGDRRNADCVACHRDDDVHEGSNGDDCGACHDIADWHAVIFNHTTRTSFALPPGHDELACDVCHTSNVHDSLPRDCAGCHEDAHEGQLGTQCDGCHVATVWTGRTWFDHDITRFPLIGVHADVACGTCHSSSAFHDTETECVACHGKEDVHTGAFGPQCDGCHNPSTWSAWQFDHGTRTSFALTGAHEGLACAACHAPSPKRAARVSDDCNSCHRRVDPHFGRFGNKCGSCHTTASFAEIEDL